MHVEDGDVEALPGIEQLQRLERELGGAGGMPHVARLRVRISAVGGVVIDHEDALAARAPGTPSMRGAWLGTSAASTCEREQEGRTAPGLALAPTSCPPISSTRRLEIASPRPVPPYLRVVEASTWVKDWNSRSDPSGAMPMPVSRTRSSSRWRAGSARLGSDVQRRPRPLR